jgi:hypothetical protein
MKPKDSMKTASLLEPPSLTAPRPRRYRRRTLNAFYLAANDVALDQLSAMTKISQRRLEVMLSSPRARQEIAKIRFKISGESANKAFMKILPEAIQTNLDIMRDPKGKASTRLMAAMNFQDRALGKPKQEVDVNHKSPARLVLEQILAEKNQQQGLPDLDAEFRFMEDEQVQVIESKPEEPSKDAVDAWIAENL